MRSATVNSLKKFKNPRDVFTKRDGAFEIVAQSNKHKAAVLVKWLSEKCVE